MRVVAWHFTGATLRDGRPLPPVGEWLTHEGQVDMCRLGLHASRRALDALSYAPGVVVHLVECEEVVKEDNDKLVCRRRRILASVDSTGPLWAFSRWAALSVIHLWNAPEVVRRFLETGDESLRAAARAAVEAAARDAARAAVGAAARNAAWAAGWAAARAAHNERLEAMLLVALGSKHPVLLRRLGFDQEAEWHEGRAK